VKKNLDYREQDELEGIKDVVLAKNAKGKVEFNVVEDKNVE